MNIFRKLHINNSLNVGILCLLILILLFVTPKVFGGTLIVSQSPSDAGSYATINDALKKATDGDLIEVKTGKYNEKLEIQKSIHLKGINNPVITVEKGRIIDISTSGVVIEGFTLKYSGSNLSPTDTAIYVNNGAKNVIIRNNKLLDVMFGIWSVQEHDKDNNIKIKNNIIRGIERLERNSRGNCINFTGVKNSEITNNKLSYCRDGVYMELCHDAKVIGNNISESRYSIHTMWVDRGIFNDNTVYKNLVGLAIMYTKDTQVKSNLSFGNQTIGIVLIQTLRTLIKDNIVIANSKGIYINNCESNKIISNLFMNSNIGLHSSGSGRNVISQNSFIRNEGQVKFAATKNQQWDNNYWSDYLGWDMTGDDVGDTPYESNSVVDYIFWKYPMAKILYASPALQTLWLLEKQFPSFKVPRVVDTKPSMKPFHKNWKKLLTKYSYTPERYYGDIVKLPHIHGAGH